jgi:hypothetical protein
MSQTKQRRQSRRQGVSEVHKQGSCDAKRNESVLLIAPGEPNPNAVSAIVSEWVAPRLAEEFLREHRHRLAKEEVLGAKS